MKPPPFQTNRRMAEEISGSSHQMPPVWAVSASPTLMMTSRDGLSVLGYIVICGVSVAMFCYNRHLDAGEKA